MFRPDEEQNTVQKIGAKIKVIMMKEKDIDNISTQYVRCLLMNWPLSLVIWELYPHLKISAVFNTKYFIETLTDSHC